MAFGVKANKKHSRLNVGGKNISSGTSGRVKGISSKPKVRSVSEISASRKAARAKLGGAPHHTPVSHMLGSHPDHDMHGKIHGGTGARMVPKPGKPHTFKPPKAPKMSKVKRAPHRKGVV